MRSDSGQGVGRCLGVFAACGAPKTAPHPAPNPSAFNTSTPGPAASAHQFSRYKKMLYKNEISWLGILKASRDHQVVRFGVGQGGSLGVFARPIRLKEPLVQNLKTHPFERRLFRVLLNRRVGVGQGGCLGVFAGCWRSGRGRTACEIRPHGLLPQ
jgi:hypothetical protein